MALSSKYSGVGGLPSDGFLLFIYGGIAGRVGGLPSDSRFLSKNSGVGGLPSDSGFLFR